MSYKSNKNSSSNNHYTEIENYSNKIWDKNNINSVSSKSEKEPFTIMMPPPNVTGSLHIGHALNMTLQDILSRFWRLNNKNVLWQPGTDHAGIATQMVVERKLLSDGEPGRKEIGRENFLTKVWEWKDQSGGNILNQLRRLGASADWKRERFTLDKALSEAVKEAFITLYEEGLIYRDKRLVNWDTKLQTAISDLEVIQKEVKGHYWHFKYPVVNSKDYLIIATTRPETMLGDTAVAVHPEDTRYKKLIGKKVLLPIVNKEIAIIADDYADPEKGTGAVKITPAHDFNDFLVGKRNNLEVVNILTADGKLNNNVPKEYKNLSIFNARQKVIKDMDNMGLLDVIEETIHVIPYGDRSDTVIEPYLTDQWFVDARKLAGPAIDAVKTGETVFVPKSWENTFFDWMNNIEPWCISRQLWWGHRIPAWYSDKGDIFVAKTHEDALIKAKTLYGKEVKLQQDEDVLDTWFSSGLWPFSTLDWPKKNNYLLKHYPGDVLVTGFDIIFFWVARMMMLGIHFMNKSPFREVYVHALVRDSKGDKMSKSKGNVVDPLKLMDKYGTDSIRFTLAALATQGRDIKLSEDRIVGYRNFLTKINNVSRFLEISSCKLDDNFNFSNVKLPINHWILHLLDNFTDKVYKDLTSYRFNEAANNLYQFVWHYYCDWYIEFVKITINNKDSEEVRNIAAYVFKKILILLHPLVPFSTEYLYSKKHKFGSVLALEVWSKNDVGLIVCKDNLAEVNWIIKLITEIRSLRNILNIGYKSLINLSFIELDSIKINYISNNEFVLKDIAKVGVIKQIANEEKEVAQILVDNATFYIPLKGLIDIDKEYERLNIDLTKLKNDISIIDKKLNNKDFLKRAPEEIVKEQKDKKLRLVGSVEKINTALEKISKKH